MVHAGKMKVIHVLCKLEPGGAERMVLELARALPKEQYDVSVIATHGGGALESEFRAAGIETYVVGRPSTSSGNDGVADKVRPFRRQGRTFIAREFLRLWKLARLLRKLKPDVVHTHLFAGDTWGRIATVMAFPFSRPMIISTEHNTNIDEGALKRWIKWVLLFFTDKIVAVSDAVREYSMRVDGIHAGKMVVVRHGVTAPKDSGFSHRHSGVPPWREIQDSGTMVIGCVARLEEQKGHGVFFDAFKKLQATSYKLQASLELWLVGDGSLRAQLEAQAKALGIAGRVKFLGTRTDVPALLEQMDIVVLPSRWEGAGLALLEAQAAGKPVVATRVGGIPEYIEDTVSGFIVEPENVSAFAEALERLASNTELRQQMGEAGRKFVAEKFTLERMVGEYSELYHSLLQATSYKLQAPYLRDAVVAVTYLCQSRCNMCSIWMNKEAPLLTPADMAMLPTSLRNINVSGGEPFLRPDLPEMIRAIKKRVPKAKIIISSNGFATKRILEHMKKILAIDPKVGIAISIDGVGAMHERVRGIPGGFRMCMETLLGLQKLGMKNLRLAFTAQQMNIEHLPLVDALASACGVEFTMSAVHNSSHYFQKEDNAHDHLETYRTPFQIVVRRALGSWSPKRWLRAYYMEALLEFLKTGRRVLPSYTGVRSFFLDPKRRVYPSVVSAVSYGALADCRLRIADYDGRVGDIEMMIAAQPDTTMKAREQQQWMICTAREAMRVHWARVGWWIIKEKSKLHVRGMLPKRFQNFGLRIANFAVR